MRQHWPWLSAGLQPEREKKEDLGAGEEGGWWHSHQRLWLWPLPRPPSLPAFGRQTHTVPLCTHMAVRHGREQGHTTYSVILYTTHTVHHTKHTMHTDHTCCTPHTVHHILYIMCSSPCIQHMKMAYLEQSCFQDVSFIADHAILVHGLYSVEGILQELQRRHSQQCTTSSPHMQTASLEQEIRSQERGSFCQSERRGRERRGEKGRGRREGVS